MTSPISSESPSSAPKPALDLSVLDAKVKALAEDKAKPDFERSPLFPAKDQIFKLRYELKATIAETLAILEDAGLKVSSTDLTNFCKGAFPDQFKKTAKGRGRKAPATKKSS